MKKLYMQKKVLALMLLLVVFNVSLKGQDTIMVTNTTDPDQFLYRYNYVDSLCAPEMLGTLQWAIRKANDSPAYSVVIVINIPGLGPHVIYLYNYLPMLMKPITIDGSTQPGYNYSNGPSIIIDGTNVPYNSYCFNTSGSSEGYVIKGLLIRNFYLSTGINIWGSDSKIINNVFQNVGGYDPAYYRAMGVYIAAPNCIIQGNVFGTDITGTENYGSNAEAIYLQNQWLPADNCIIGGSGVNEPNIVANSGSGGGWAGISITNGKHNRISRNRIYNNPIGIQLMIYGGPTWWGNEGKTAPVITSATADTVSGTSAPNDIIEIFGSTGNENANEYLTTTVADPTGSWTAQATTTYPNVIATGTDGNNNTSGLSTAYQKPINTGNTCDSSIIVIHQDKSEGITLDMTGYEKWIKFTATANKANFVLYCYSEPVELTLYSGNCNNLNIIKQENDSMLSYDLFQTGQDYYIKISTNTTGISIKVQLIRSSPLDCSTSSFTQCNKIYNNGYTGTYTPVSDWDMNAFYNGEVPGWYGYSQTSPNDEGVNIFMDSGTPVMVLESPTGDCPWDNGTSYACTDIQPDIIYMLRFDAKLYSPTTTVWGYQLKAWTGDNATFGIGIQLLSMSTIHILNNDTWSHYERLFKITGNSKDLIILNGQTIWSSGLHVCSYAHVFIKNVEIVPFKYDDYQVCQSGPPVQLVPSCLSVFSGSGLNANYTWTPTAGLSSSTIANPFANPGITTVYNLDIDYNSGNHINEDVNVEVIINNQINTHTVDICHSPIQICASTYSGTSFLWSTGETTECITVYSPGNVSCTSQLGSCTIIDEFTIQDVHFSVNISNVIPDCNSSCNGQASVSSGGILPDNYLWSNGYSGPTATSLCAGNYTVTVTDANGCTATDQVLITDNPLPSFTSTITPPNECSTPCDGTIILNPAGTYLYTWGDIAVIPGIHTQNLTNVCYGEYTVIVTSAPGCSITATYTVPIPPIFTAPPTLTWDINGNITVSNNTTISTGLPYSLPGNITVLDGKTLTVTGSNTALKFLPNKRIYMNPGSSIVVTNYAKLTSHCSKMWTGIVANSNNSAKPINILISNGGTIENAICGIYAFKYVYVKSYKGYFYNNWQDIYFNAIKLTLTPEITQSYFYTTLSHLYSPNLFPSAHIYAANTTRIKMSNNTFGNTVPYTGDNVNVINRGKGIWLSNTQLDATLCNFKNLWYGVLTNSLTKIYNCNFGNNNRGIWVESSSSTGSQIYKNKFIVGGSIFGTPGQTIPTGLCVKNCPSYEVEENTFKDGAIGLTMINNTITGKKVYLNKFDNLYYAFVANIDNGLKLTCNDFGKTTLSNFYDICLFDGKIFNIQDHAQHAVDFPQDPPFNSHNRFVNTHGNTTTDALKFNVAGTFLTYHYDYYYGDNSDFTKINPVNSAYNVTPISDFAHPWFGATYCQSQINGGKAVGKELTKIDSLKDALTYRQNYYNAIVDNGNTDYLLSLIQNLQPNNFNFAYNKLMNASPYLSDTVLINFMTHPINKPPFKKAVVLANSPLPLRVRPYIDIMNVNQNFKNQMWAAQTNNNNARTNLENEIANRDFGINDVFGDLVISALSDSIPEKTDTLLTYVLQNGNFNERIITAPVFVEKIRYTDAQTNLNEISAMNDGTSEISIPETNDFIQMQNLAVQVNQTPDSLKNILILQNETWLTGIANDTSNFFQADAMSFLEIAYDTIYPRSIWVKDLTQARSMRTAAPIENEEIPCGLDVAPNPASTLIKITISKVYIENGCTVKIHNDNGQVVKLFNIANVSNFISVDVSHYAKGKYYLSLQNGSETICVKLLVVE